MMERNRELEYVHVVAFENVVENGSALYELRLDELHVLHALVIGLDDLNLSFIFKRQAKGPGDSLDGRELAVESSKAFGLTWHLIEAYAACFSVAALRKHLGRPPHP